MDFQKPSGKQQMRVKLTIAYDGAPYAGWQTQPQALTVQSVLEDALSEVAKTPIQVFGSGRTDAGVHADGQVAHFDAPSTITIPAKKWVHAVNAKLPSSIRVMASDVVDPSFHSRFSATQKTYCYSVDTTPVLHPLWVGRVWHVPQAIDWECLEACVQSYLGCHHFVHFSALRGNESEQTSYERTIVESKLTKTDQGFLFTVSAEGFLYKMVRILIGVAVQTAQGRIDYAEIKKMLSSSDQSETKFNRNKYCAPAAGLTLQKVSYAE